MTDIWPYPPMLGCLETLEWMTDVLGSRTGEQRIALRSEPRQSFGYASRLESLALSKAKIFARRNGAELVYVPVWGDHQRIAGTVLDADTSLVFDSSWGDWRVGFPILVWSSPDNYVEATVAAITGTGLDLTLPVGLEFDNPIVAPLRLAYMPEGASLNRAALQADVEILFMVDDNTDLASQYVSTFPQYQSMDVMVDRPWVIEMVGELIIRAAEYIDSGYGPVQIETTKNYADYGQTITFMEDRSAIWQRKLWLHNLRGRQKSFWLPSFLNDFQLQVNISAAATTIQITSVGPASYYVGKHIMIEKKDGTRYFRLITTASSVDPDTDQLTMSSSLGAIVNVVDVLYISVIAKCRLATDKVDISHQFTRKSTIIIPTVEVPE